MAQKINLLAIETSTSRASVALSVAGKRFVLDETGTHQHAKVLLLMIEQLLSTAGIDFKALDGIVFGEGPGSFTGVRVACSVAKGLAYAYNLPVFPVSGLQAIASEVRQFKQPALVMLDARMHQVYWAFEPQLDCIAKVSSPENVCIPENTPVVLAGVGFKPYVAALPEVVRQAIISQHDIFPEASVMIDLVQAGGIASVTAEKAVPSYVREQVTGDGRG
ncbi:MAG: tRNA (adenosine(37)-N6)-threonylcarbamoyltransferase complex dimerization subunit type 1 TsaB [Legionella sp.]|nr:tRNA (adenosine(37)-N6)-threonylcarbamoyltransferase complex dimerization subunit type 1 TsaB [Legionella sp.]